MSLEKLDHLTLIKVTGSDSRAFLQGQLTNDIEKATTVWQFSGYCNPKGRLLALLQVWRNDSDTYVIMDSSVVQATIKRLNMYVMRSDVSIETVNEASFYGCFSENAWPELAGMHNHDVKRLAESLFALSYDDRFLIIDLGNAVTGSQGKRWLSADISDGLPQVNAQSVELFIPQMLNLDLLNGISFKKGCYTGQEIVARMHYLGKLKQRMFLCKASASTELVQTGNKIMADGKPSGTIVSASPESKEVLAVLRIETAEHAELTLENGGELSVLSQQPYSLPA